LSLNQGVKGIFEVGLREIKDEIEGSLEAATNAIGVVEYLGHLFFLVGIYWVDVFCLLLLGKENEELKVVDVGFFLHEMDTDESLQQPDKGLHFGGHESVFIHFIGRGFQAIVGVENILELAEDKVKNALDELDFGIVFEQGALEKSQQIGHYSEDVLLDFE
jgi:hypothetical protein